ncbi:uncharacterized protein EI97DRAFT_20624 [Westerdykella ornata]|uniref:Uncharacterized protein n=1 Tax=Westerdykella ornata TaxID=318751 RepID=A0A6A6JWX8_WESOR|nr:uncharacterized protein EI97DRAFT_20624 [Westerdykella ornata]KAF2281121.1 hypothetical protein EI97DRAFT_20624 [Westerdykella ornata]
MSHVNHRFRGRLQHDQDQPTLRSREPVRPPFDTTNSFRARLETGIPTRLVHGIFSGTLMKRRQFVTSTLISRPNAIPARSLPKPPNPVHGKASSRISSILLFQNLLLRKRCSSRTHLLLDSSDLHHWVIPHIRYIPDIDHPVQGTEYGTRTPQSLTAGFSMRSYR